jgi:hypothetical protein
LPLCCARKAKHSDDANRGSILSLLVGGTWYYWCSSSRAQLSLYVEDWDARSRQCIGGPISWAIPFVTAVFRWQIIYVVQPSVVYHATSDFKHWYESCERVRCALSASWPKDALIVLSGKLLLVLAISYSNQSLTHAASILKYKMF